MIKKKSLLSSFFEYIFVIAIAVIIAILIRTFIIHPYMIPTSSMEPTILMGDNLLIEKITYRFHSPKVGEIVVFNNPSGVEKQLIKRVIGVPGDHVEITEDGHVILNGKAYEEHYAIYQDIGQSFNFDIKDGTVFVLGDNRGNSQDSRWIGPISEDIIIGRAIFRHWPLDRFGPVK